MKQKLKISLLQTEFQKNKVALRNKIEYFIQAHVCGGNGVKQKGDTEKLRKNNRRGVTNSFRVRLLQVSCFSHMNVTCAISRGVFIACTADTHERVLHCFDNDGFYVRCTAHLSPPLLHLWRSRRKQTRADTYWAHGDFQRENR